MLKAFQVRTVDEIRVVGELGGPATPCPTLVCKCEIVAVCLYVYGKRINDAAGRVIKRGALACDGEGYWVWRISSRTVS